MQDRISSQINTELHKLEIMFSKNLEVEEFQSQLRIFLNNEIPVQKPLELNKIDKFTKNFYLHLLSETELWIIRGFIIGAIKMVENTSSPTIYKPLFDVNKLSPIVHEAAIEKKLTLRTTMALEWVYSHGAEHLTEATSNTILRARKIIFDNIKNGKGTKALTDALYEEFRGEEGETNRNWKRVSNFETNNAFNQGYVAQLKHGEWVYGMSIKNQCEHCRSMIEGKYYPVIKINSGEFKYDNLNPDSGEYKRRAWIWQNAVWAGKENIGRSGKLQKLIIKEGKNLPDNLIKRQHHELFMPCIPLHVYCNCRWIGLHPNSTYIDVNGDMKLRMMDEMAWRRWYLINITPIIEQFQKYGIELDNKPNL